MPELPEVEHARRLLERIARGRRIEGARASRDEIVYAEASAEEVSTALRGRRVLGTGRRGKYLWLELDSPPHPVFHLGMTGTFRHPGDDPLVLASSPRSVDRAWPPRFTKIEVILDDGGRVAMTNARRLGRIVLRDDPEAEPPISRLGFDPLVDMPDVEGLTRLLRGRRGVIKGLLLDQRFAAGVGNWMADEVLYRAGIDPRRRANELRDDELASLHAALEEVVRVAVAADARKAALPSDWLFHRRWGRKSDARAADGSPVEYLTVAGRTTAWVPSRQR